MKEHRILFLSVNDGTDTRIAKEIATLEPHASVTFVGVRQEDNGPNRLPAGVEQVILRGRRRGVGTMLRLLLVVLRLRLRRFDSVHVVNENLLFAMMPALLGARRVVLDIFDSVFLKGGMFAGRLKGPFQWLAHRFADVALVTDDNRFGLIPERYRGGVRVLPNYPTRVSGLPPRRVVDDGSPLRIFFSGSLNAERGIPFLRSVLEQDSRAEVVVAGWIYDEAARELCGLDRVSYKGVVSAAEAAGLARQCDYILCLYSPDVENNIHASPNKIYDSAMLGVPVIINREVMASAFVEKEGLGHVLDAYGPPYPGDVCEVLRRRRGMFCRGGGSSWTWDGVEKVLVSAHLGESR